MSGLVLDLSPLNRARRFYAELMKDVAKGYGSKDDAVQRASRRLRAMGWDPERAETAVTQGYDPQGQTPEGV